MEHKPVGEWGFAAHKKRGRVYVVVTKDGKADSYTGEDHNYLKTCLFQGSHSEISEGFFSFPNNFGIVQVLLDAGFQQGESNAQRILDYMKEQGL